MTPQVTVTNYERSPRGISGALFVTTPNGRMVAKNEAAHSKKEYAAYLIDSYLNWNLVPTVIVQNCSIGNLTNELFSFQEFIENAYTFYNFKIEFDYYGHTYSPIQAQDEVTEYLRNQSIFMCAFDFIICNKDRHDENFMIDEFAKLWAIDNGGSFYIESGLHVSNIPNLVFNDEFANDLLNGINNLLNNKELLSNELLPYLHITQITSVFDRAKFLADNLVKFCKVEIEPFRKSNYPQFTNET